MQRQAALFTLFPYLLCSHLEALFLKKRSTHMLPQFLSACVLVFREAPIIFCQQFDTYGKANFILKQAAS